MCQVVTQLRINAAIMCWAKNRLHGICFSLVSKSVVRTGATAIASRAGHFVLRELVRQVQAEVGLRAFADSPLAHKVRVRLAMTVNSEFSS